MQTQNKFMQRLIYGFGISMAVLMAVSLFLPALAPPQLVQPELQATNTPIPPTFPPPIRDFSAIQLNEDYLHPSGVFSVRVPAGWEVGTTVNDTQRAQVNLNNPDAVSRIQIGVEIPPTEIVTLDDLNNFYNDGRVQQIWIADYANISELGRPSVDDRLIINFRLRDRQQRNFLAQQIAYVEDGLVYFSRVVMPENAQDALFYVSELMSDTVTFNDQFREGPFGWNSHYDRVHEWVLRYPRTWTRTDGNDGLPTSFQSEAGIALRVEVTPNTSVDENTARALVERRFTGAEIISVEEIERAGGVGYSVAYQTRTFDGEAVSGVAVVLNGVTGSLYVASAIIPEGNIDLNEENGNARYNDLHRVLASFSLLSGLNLPEPEAQPTATPFPTSVPAVEETPEASTDTEETEVDEAEEAEETEATDEVEADEADES